MTALSGFWAMGSAEPPREACARILDGQRAYATAPPVIWSDGPVALGKRLHATLDEDAFDCGPVSGGGGRWRLVADVRLDERRDLAAALGIARDDEARLSDSALVMRAIERWGEEAIGRIYGDFALALWDAERERLVLARDLAGQRPLHFHDARGFFAFASMPIGLKALAGVGRAADEEAIAQFLTIASPEGGRSFFEGIERVGPAEMRVVTRAGSSASRHWFFQGERRLRGDTDYVDAAREALDRAVGARLRGAGGRVAAHLSGGLDSGGVAATAARLLAPGGQVSAFTSVPSANGPSRRGRFADEGAHAAAVAALYPNMDHVLVRTGGRSPIASLDRNFELYQAPVLNLCNYAWGDAIAEQAQARRHRVLLIGQVGNFTLSYPGLDLLPQLLARGRLLRLLREAKGLRRHGLAAESIAGLALRPFIPVPLWNWINRLRGRRVALAEFSAINPALLERMNARGGLGHMRATAREDTRPAMIGAIDTGNFRQGALAGWGLDVRDPTADRRLIELCFSIPLDRYLSGGMPRALARRALADRLPPLIVGETRKGFQAADWHEGVTAALGAIRAEVLAISQSPQARRLLDMPRLNRLVAAAPPADWDSHAAQADYRLALLRAISAGHFVRRAGASA